MGDGLKILRNERGSAVALVAIALVALVGAAALALDAGQLFINRARLVNALDSAVLAGVQYLPDRPDLALQTAAEYAQINGLDGNEHNFQIGESNRSIAGQAKREVPLQFAQVLGLNLGEVKAEAAARVSPISAVSGVVPFGVLEGDYNYGEIVTLKEAAGANAYAGWYGALRLEGNGASVYENNVKYGCKEEIAVNDVIPIESGNMSGPTRRGIEYRINQCRHYPHCTIDSFVEGCSRVLIVPIVRIEQINNGNHPSSLRVLGFAAFLVTRYTGHGDENEVEGAFVRYVAPGETQGNASDFGLYSASLYQ